MRDDHLPLAERIERALSRIKNGEAPMRCPVEATDPDVVLADCAAEIAKLQEAVLAYGDHTGCRLRSSMGSYAGEDEKYCDCGWTAVRRAIEAKVQADPVGGPSAIRSRLMRAASVIEALGEEETTGGAR